MECDSQSEPERFEATDEFSQLCGVYSVPLDVQIFGPYAGALQDNGELLELQRPDLPDIDTNGVVFIPPNSLKNCLSEAAKFLSISVPGKGKATYTKNFEAGIKSTLFDGKVVANVSAYHTKFKDLQAAYEAADAGGAGTASPFNLSVEDGSVIGFSILSCWAAAWAFKVLARTVRDVGDTD